MSLKLRILAPALAIVLPASVLVSMGCGIIALPVTAPVVMVKNLRHLHFVVDIVDEAGTPLADVTVSATRYALKVDPLFTKLGDYKADPPRVVNGQFTYDTFGNNAVLVQYTRQGYAPTTCLYSTADEPKLEPRFGLNALQVSWDSAVNIARQPRSQVVLKRAP